METEQQPTNIPSATNTPPETIFSDMMDTKPYEKNLRTARIWLYVVAGIQAAIGVYEYASTSDKDLAVAAALIDGGIAVMFLLLAVWSYKKPAIAFMTALIAYIVIHVGMMILD